MISCLTRSRLAIGCPEQLGGSSSDLRVDRIPVAPAAHFACDRLDSGLAMLTVISLAVPTPPATWAVVLLLGPAIHWSFSALMFRLHLPDVLPVGDLGIVRAVQRAYGLRKPPTPERLMRLGEPWRPYRSVACWYLWASLDNTNAKE